MHRFNLGYRQPLAVLALLLFALAFQGSRGLWSPDEGRYTDVALEMLRLGDLTHPMLNHEHAHYTKPPLTYWAIAASTRLLGRSEWAVRLPYAVAFTLTVLMLYWLGRHFLPDRAWLPALVYATSFLPYEAGNIVTTDTLLTLFETLGMAAFVAAENTSQQRARGRLLILMWAGFGLAFLTKGPPGLLPLLAILVFAAWQDGRRGLRRVFHPVGLAVFAAVGVSWYVVVILRAPGLLEYFLRYELIARVASDAHHRHGEWYGAFVVYVPTLIVGALPWGVLLLNRVRRAWVGPVQWPRRLRQLGPSMRLALLWFLLPLIVFTLARSRLPLYVLPLFVPLALITARAIAPVFDPKRLRVRIGLGLLAALLVAIRWYASVMPYGLDDRALAMALTEKAGSGYSEIVFVDSKPRFGLGFYLDAEVEEVCFKTACTGGGLVADEALDTELSVGERHQLYLVRESARDEFLGYLSTRGGKPEPMGTVRGFALVRSGEPRAENGSSRSPPRRDGAFD